MYANVGGEMKVVKEMGE